MRILGFIDRRLKEIFPARSLQPFGGINVVVCGDFHQLPPVGGTPLFSKAKKLNAEKLVGQQAYRSLDTTVRLTKVMRQDGEDDDTVQFRKTLSQLRVGSLTSENWRFLLRRVKATCPPTNAISSRMPCGCITPYKRFSTIITSNFETSAYP